MPENRYFIDREMKQGDTITLPEEELRHLRVMRKKPGDNIQLVNGRNDLADAALLTPETAQILSVSHAIPTKQHVILAIALLKPKNLDLVIEKGTELGATEFWLFPAEKSEKKSLSEGQRRRLRHLTISALKQCGRLDLPPIVEKLPLFKWDPLQIPLFYASPSSKTPLSPPDALVVVIGPEGGLSDQEITHLKHIGSQDISLGPNTLRAETAALCALVKALL